MKDRWEETIFHMAEEEQMVMPQSMTDRIEEITKERRTDRCSRFRVNFKKSVILAAAMIMLISATAVASVGALRERMEAMNREKLEAYFTQIYTTKVGVDNYNRPYSDTEKERMTQLRAAYENEAHFPEGELTMIEDAGEYKGRGVAFLGDTNTFFFPEKEMSDEELLRVIDFMYKRDYSLQKMNEMIASGEAQVPQIEEPEIEATEEEVLATDAVYEPTQSLTIPYTGGLELDQSIASGRNELFLAGYNTIHRMEIGSSDSEVFFDDFGVETRILAMCQAGNGDLYIALWQWPDAETATEAEGTQSVTNMEKAEGAQSAEDTEAAERVTLAVWVVDRNGELLRKIDLESYIKTDRQGYIGRMAVDDNGYLYLNVVGMRLAKKTWESVILVLDRDGNYVTQIAPEEYALRRGGGLGVGKDGRVYTYIENYYDPDDTQYRMGIASLDVEKGELGDVYFDIMPEDSFLIDIVAPGAASDFVFWGYSGIFTYDLGDERAVNVLPVYEAPCDFEGARVCALPDGRIVFADTSEYRSEDTAYGKRFYAVPEKTCFYYVPGMKNE